MIIHPESSYWGIPPLKPPFVFHHPKRIRDSPSPGIGFTGGISTAEAVLMISVSMLTSGYMVQI